MSDAPILAGVNHVDDIESASDFEKKHTPYVVCDRVEGRVTVMVKVGHWVAHPNVPDHFIQWIDIAAGGVSVARFELSAMAVDPVLTCVLDVDAGTPITALENCNLHGLWISDAISAP